MRVNKILVPTDFSPNAQRALEQATDLARQLGAGLYVLHVAESSPMRTAIQANLFVPGSTDASLKANVLQLLGSRLSEFVAAFSRVTRRSSRPSCLLSWWSRSWTSPGASAPTCSSSA